MRKDTERRTGTIGLGGGHCLVLARCPSRGGRPTVKSDLVSAPKPLRPICRLCRALLPPPLLVANPGDEPELVRLEPTLATVILRTNQNKY